MLLGKARSFRLFSVFGITVEAGLNGILMLSFIAFSLGQYFSSELRSESPVFTEKYPYAGYLMGFGSAILLFAAVVAHELSHSLVARRFGAEVKRIRFFLLGAVSFIEKEENMESPGKHFLVAFAGPLMSFFLAIIFLGFYLVFRSPIENPYVFVAAHVVMYLGWINGVLTVFNLIPAFPLDGGRMLLATLQGLKMQRQKAMKATFLVSNMISLAMIFGGIALIVFGDIWNGVMLMVVAIFLYLSVRREKFAEIAKIVKVNGESDIVRRKL